MGATVIAAENDWGTGCDTPLGVRASVTPAGSRNLQPLRSIQTTGDSPIAEPAGPTGTVMVFNSGLASSDSFSSSFLPAAGAAHARTSLAESLSDMVENDAGTHPQGALSEEKKRGDHQRCKASEESPRDVCLPCPCSAHHADM